MKDIIYLAKLEVQKMKKLVYIKWGILAVFIVMGILIINEASDLKAYNENQAYREEVLSWKERESNLITYAEEDLDSSYFSESQKQVIRKRIDIAKYRLTNDIPKSIYKNVWWFFNDNSFDTVLRVVQVILAFLICAVIAGEYSGKTIGQLLLLPYQRHKIITSKILAVFSIGFLFYIGIFLLGTLSGFLLHGTNGLTARVVLYPGNTLITMNMTVYSLLVVLMKLIEFIFFTLLIVFLCIITKSAAVSAIAGVFLVLGGVPVTFFLSSYYGWMAYLPFANLDFRRYLDYGTVMPSLEATFKPVVAGGITPLTSAVIVGISMFVLIAGTVRIFKKQNF